MEIFVKPQENREPLRLLRPYFGHSSAAEVSLSGSLLEGEEGAYLSFVSILRAARKFLVADPPCAKVSEVVLTKAEEFFVNCADMTVRDVMQSKFVSVQADMDIYKAIQTILNKGLMGVPVVEGNKLIGVFSEKDCFKILANWTFQMSQQTGGIVQHYMTTDILTVEASASLSAVAGEFLTHFYRGLPVVDEGDLVGLVSRRDILKAMLAEQNSQRTANYPDSKYGSNIPELG